MWLIKLTLKRRTGLIIRERIILAFERHTLMRRKFVGVIFEPCCIRAGLISDRCQKLNGTLH